MKNFFSKHMGIAVVLLMASFMQLDAQATMSDVLLIFKKGVEAQQQGLFDDAIKALNEAVEKCIEVGEDADDVRIQAENILPTLYFESANALVKANRISEATERYLQAEAAAKKASNESILSKVKTNIPQLYNSLGNTAYKNKDLAKALEYYTKAVEYDSLFGKGYFGLGIIYKEQDKEDLFQATMLKAIRICKINNDEKTIDRAVDVASKYFYNKALLSRNATKYEQSVLYFKTSLLFNDTYEDALLGLAKANNELNRYDEAIEAVNKALAVTRSDDAGKAKYYFELGRALQGKKSNAEACVAYAKAKYGEFLKSAEYQMVNILKCQ